ncbi:MAG: hypothetical protein IT514_01580, partial [Burkholderiales bacterium]|nr:hypothetical protein [Burkholderiales bacterium]
GTRPNWARQSTVSGLVFGDAGMPYLDALSESGFGGLFETGERYLATARRVRPQARFAALFCNGGPKSAGSVEHSHVQITAREDRHFAYAEEIARRCPPDYWERLHRAHAQAGLTIRWSECPAWVNLAPLKERDITVLSADLRSGAQSTYRIWRALARSGTRDFTLAAILAPGYVAGEGATPRFARWPNVVWRFVDRGDPEVRHGDIGAMELFASAVVANDPYGVAALLREAQP